MEHEKGARPCHFHVVYSIIDLATGRAIPSHGNFKRDELISRQLEIAFGERIVPGPRIAANIAELRRRGLHSEADRLAPFEPVWHADGPSRIDRQHADRLGVRGPEWSFEAFVVFERCDRDLARFAREVVGSGYAVARSKGRATLLVDDETGYHTSLVRLLRREAKAAGQPLHLREVDVKAAFTDVPPVGKARDTGLERARQKAERDVEAERRTATYEALVDGDAAELEAFRVRRRKKQEEEQGRAQDDVRATLKDRREAIQAFYRERDEVRRRRVDRAFRAAGLFASPEIRRLAFGLAAAGVLMTGGGLAMALAGGFYAAHLVPTRAGARGLAEAARQERSADAATRRADLDDANRRSRNGHRTGTGAVRFRFEQVAKEDRVLAGAYADVLLRGETSSTVARDAAEALGPAIVAGLERMLERGSPLQVRRLRHWYRGIAPGRRSPAVEAALKRHVASRGAPPAAPDHKDKPESARDRTGPNKPIGSTKRRDRKGMER